MTQAKVNCPRCGKEVIWAPTSEYRPFCSERCQLIDLGDWAAEKHRVSGDAHYDDVPHEESGDEHD